jgi:flagellar hook-associated protein 2
MPSIQLGGLATGLDTSSLVSQLMAVERQPVTALETRKVKLQAISAAFRDLNSKLLSIKSAADLLKTPETFFPRSVSSSKTDVATATAAAGSARGTFAMTVTALARGSIATAGNTKDALTDTVAEAAGTFQFKLGASGPVVSVTVDTATTLEQLVKAINDKNAGVNASAVNVGTSDAPAYKLALTSTGTGAANNIVVVGDPTTLALANSLTADDAAFSIQGLGDFKRSTNTFSDVIDGVTITLKASSGSTDLTVAPDISALQGNVQSLVDAYNKVVTTIDGQTAVAIDANGTPQLGAFTGDVVPQLIRRGLAAIVATRLDGALGSLSQIGITTQKDGTLALDAAKLKQALTSDPQAVSDLVAGTSTRDGIADLFSAKIADLTKAVTGSIAARQDGISSQMRDIAKQITAAEARLESTEKVLRARFNNLETLVSRLQSTGNSLLSNLAAMQSGSSIQSMPSS